MLKAYVNAKGHYTSSWGKKEDRESSRGFIRQMVRKSLLQGSPWCKKMVEADCTYISITVYFLCFYITPKIPVWGRILGYRVLLKHIQRFLCKNLQTLSILATFYRLGGGGEGRKKKWSKKWLNDIFMVILQVYEQAGNRNTPKLQCQFPQKERQYMNAGKMPYYLISFFSHERYL